MTPLLTHLVQAERLSAAERRELHALLEKLDAKKTKARPSARSDGPATR